jgi:hypothetical protein
MVALRGLVWQQTEGRTSSAVLDGKLFFNISNSLLNSNDAGSTIYVTDGTAAGTQSLYSTSGTSSLIRMRGTLDDKIVFQTGLVYGNHDAVLRSLSADETSAVLVANPHPESGARAVNYTFTPSAHSVLVS